MPTAGAGSRKDQNIATTSILEVGDLFSILDVHGIERQLRRIAGVSGVSLKVTVKTITTPQHVTPHECCSGKPPATRQQPERPDENKRY